MSMSRGIPFRWSSRCVLEVETDLAVGCRVDPFRRSRRLVTRGKPVPGVACFPFFCEAARREGREERRQKHGNMDDKNMDDKNMGRLGTRT